MRSLVYFIACTVDGYVAARDGSFDFFGFEGPQVPDLLAEFPEMIPGTPATRSGSSAPTSGSTRS